MDELTFEFEQVCPYLHDRTSRLPLRLQLLPVVGESFDRILAEGNRRTGRYLYRTQCPTCQECEPIRLCPSEFVPTRGQRRVWNRGQKQISVQLAAPIVEQRRVEIFNAHRNQRGMNQSASTFDESDYIEFLTETCCDTVALDYYVEGQLIAVAIIDRGASAWSAVYTFFDPEFSHLSPGTFSILTQIEVCREQNIQWLYLGYFIENCVHMRYKEAYRPHERLIQGEWQPFGNSSS